MRSRRVRHVGATCRMKIGKKPMTNFGARFANSRSLTSRNRLFARAAPSQTAGVRMHCGVGSARPHHQESGRHGGVTLAALAAVRVAAFSPKNSPAPRSRTTLLAVLRANKMRTAPATRSRRRFRGVLIVGDSIGFVTTSLVHAASASNSWPNAHTRGPRPNYPPKSPLVFRAPLAPVSLVPAPDQVGP